MTRYEDSNGVLKLLKYDENNNVISLKYRSRDGVVDKREYDSIREGEK